MGTYHPAPLDVIAGRIGRVLEDRGLAAYGDYTAQLAEGESLWLATSVESRPIVVLVEHNPDFAHFVSQRDNYGPYSFYAIPDAQQNAQSRFI